MRISTGMRVRTGIVPRLLFALALAVGMLALTTVAADASFVRVPLFELKPEGGFGRPSSVAVDQETGDVYVADTETNTVDVFGKEGGPPSAGVPSKIEGFVFEFGAAAGVAVDNACFYHHLAGGTKECEELDPSNGDVYVASTRTNSVDKLKLNAGTEKYEVVEAFPASEPYGVAVDEDGDFYVAAFNEPSITERDSTGIEVGKIAQGAIEVPAYVAVGAPGVVYVADYYKQGVEKLQVNAKDEIEPGGETQLDSSGKSSAVDSHGNVYVVESGGVSEYNAAGERFGVGHFPLAQGQLGGSAAGVALNEESLNKESGGIYVTNLAYGPYVVQPEVAIAPVTNNEHGSATLNGTVTPGAEEASYHFEYGPCPEGLESCAAAPYPLETTPAIVGPAGEGEALPVSTNVEGLSSATAYHYRLVAVAVHDGAPLVRTGPETFESPAGIKGVGPCTVSAIEAHGATLEAPLEPAENELPVHYDFEYGTHVPAGPIYEHKTSLKELKEVSEVGIVKATVTTLLPSTTYDCRLVASREGIEVPGENGIFTTSSAPPLIESSSAEPGSPSRKTELLSGVINPENSATKYYFSYIDQAGYEAKYARSVTSEASAGGGPTGQLVGPVQINGLKAGTTYHYELVATNASKETTVGPDQTFTTAPPTPPTVQSVSVSAVTSTSATVSSLIGPNPENLATSFELDLGYVVGGQVVYAGGQFFGTIPSGQEVVTVNLENLAPSTAYYCRVFATNEDGAGAVFIQSFTTPGVPLPIVQPIAEPLLPTPAITFPVEPKPKDKPKAKPKAHKPSSKHRKHKGKHAKGGRRARGSSGKSSLRH